MTKQSKILGPGTEYISFDPSSIVLPWNKFIPIQPTSKQLAFLLLTCLEAFYGGQAGGGKSAALLAAALQYVHIPGFSAMLFRRTLTDLALPEALLETSHAWLDQTSAKWKDNDKTWRFPSGATMTFGYLEGPRDKYRYQSAAFQYIGFDELTQLREADYTYMFSRLRRRSGVDVPLRMRSASNPGDKGHNWVKQRFITEGISQGRPFIRAKLVDNPHIDKQAYIQALMKLDPITRAQLLEGDWDVRGQGTLFLREWFKTRTALPAGLRLCRCWDLASTEPKPGRDPDWTVGVLLGIDQDGFWWIGDIRRVQTTPAGVEALIKQTAAIDGVGVRIRIEQEPGSSGKTVIDHFIRTVLPGYNVTGVPSTGSKVVRAGPVSSQAEAGNIYIVPGGWVTDFLDEVDGFPVTGHDDQIDALSGAMAELAFAPEWGDIPTPAYMNEEEFDSAEVLAF